MENGVESGLDNGGDNGGNNGLGNEMVKGMVNRMINGMAARQRDVVAIAQGLGLDFFDLRFEVVPWEVMDEIAAYGLPIRAHHWSYGRVYERQRVHGRMGLSKIFEIVINNDPVYAFLLDSNSEVENLLVSAHVAAHADFFKGNVYFQRTHRHMVDEAAEHAQRIEGYKEEHGLEAVERLMDIAFALDRHIDPHKGLNRTEYPARRVVERELPEDEYADLHPHGGALSRSKQVVGERIPPHPERDLLWFLARYAPLVDWERDVLEMVREESYYFYPQFTTKILNEGWATYWHAEIIKEYQGLSPSEMLDFAALHGSVVQPGGGLSVNPYFLGYKILVDVEKRWNAMHAAGESPIDGRAKLFEIRSCEDDFSFIRNYLTQELCESLELYAYGPACSGHRAGKGPCPRCDEIRIESRELEEIVESLLRPRYNYGVPPIVVADVVQGKLYLQHVAGDDRTLDREFAEKTMGYIYQLWKAPVILMTRNERGQPLEFSTDDRGFHVEVKGRR